MIDWNKYKNVEKSAAVKKHFYAPIFYQAAEKYTNDTKAQVKLTIFFQKTFTKQNIYDKIIQVVKFNIFHNFSENDSFFYLQNGNNAL